MEKTGTTVNLNPGLIIVLLAFLISSGCKKCSNCDDLPNNVIKLQGEWEWIFTVRQYIAIDGSLYNDTILREQVNASAYLDISSDGCFRFTVEEIEYYACMDVYYVDHEEDSVPHPACQEQVALNLEGKNISTHFLVQVSGTDCVQMNSLQGTIVPFNSQSSYIVPPAHPISGLELNGYNNHFIRIQ